MAPRPFVHLHLHSQYSLLDGAIRIPDLLQRVEELNQPAVAITDHGVMFSTAQFMAKAKKTNVKPIIVCELYLLAEGELTERSTKKSNHSTLLVKNKEGYLNLSKLVTEAFINGFYYKPRVDMQLLEENAEGLICLSGCLNGVLSRQILNGRMDKAEEFAKRFQKMFGEDNFYVELQNHGIEEQLMTLEPLYDLAKKIGAPIVATNDSHYLHASDWEAHDALLCIGTGKLVSDEKRMRYTAHEYYVKSGDEMAELFSGKYSEAIDNSLLIADQCNFELETGKYYLPDYEVPEEHNIDSYFTEVAKAGLEGKRHLLEKKIADGTTNLTWKEYEERLDYELGIIIQMGFPGYFLIVWDFIKYAVDNKIPVGPGRGSGAGSLVAYTMGITGIDPLHYNLLFERFLNPDRISMPDFDIDFCMRRRGEVIQYVTEKYGWKNVAQIITFGTLKAKNAIRDVGRVLDLPYGEVDKIAKMVPDELGITLEKALVDAPDLKAEYNSNTQVKKMINIAQRLEGLTRHASTHAAGVVIAPKPLINYCPLYKSSKDEITTQYDMNDVEAIGLIKMDFLGLRTLTVLQDTLEAIKRDFGIEINLDELEDGDKDAYQLLSDAKTFGVFQFESRGMQDILQRYEPESLEDLSALNALYRPGPIKGGLVDDFIKRKHGKTPVQYIHPSMEKITEETYGVILYQEQVMQIASVVAGFSLGQADILRRAMGKKKAELMKEQQDLFVKGAAGNDISKKEALEIFDYIDKFSGYGFNKSHSTAYGLIAYHTAYLKAHYPAYFMAALMSSEMDLSDRIKMYIGECKEIGIDVLRPDINKGGVHFAVEDEKVRFCLAAIKGVGHGAVEAIVRARDEGGDFTDLFDLCERVEIRGINKKVLESLIKAGAFDSIMPNRAQAMANMERALEAGQKATKDRESGQENLFGAMFEEELDEPVSLTSAEEWPENKQLQSEKEALGFYFSGHPLEQFIPQLQTLDALTIDQIIEEGGEVKVGGIITGLKKRQTRNNELMASFSLEDHTGSVETLVFPRAYKTIANDLQEDVVVLVGGKVKMEGDSARLFATDVKALSEHKGFETIKVEVTVNLDLIIPEAVTDLIQMVKENPGDSELHLHFMENGSFYPTEMSKGGISTSPLVLSQLQKLIGSENIRVIKLRHDFSIS